MPISVFFSYAHEDEDLRNELEIHLSTLKRQGVIDTWHDRRINAGMNLDTEISRQLESAAIILLLVSPYFLASTYCNDVELRRAMERHSENTAVVIPVILHPCDWTRTSFGSLKACPTDGRPISKFPNIHDAFLEVTRSIRSVVEQSGKGLKQEDRLQNLETPLTVHNIRSSNLRIKKDFTNHEIDVFLDSTFAFIAAYFENSLLELANRNPEIKTRFVMRDKGHFTSAVYINGVKKSSCTIWYKGGKITSDDICFSHGDSTYGSGYNESLSVNSDGYLLGLKPMGIAISRPQTSANLTQQGAAEFYWDLLLRNLQ